MIVTPLSIAFNATAMLRPLNGIGRYVAELGSALERQHARIDFFAGRRWSEHLPKNRLPGRRAFGGSEARRLIGNLPGAYATDRLLQQQRFSAGVRQLKPMVYHEPAFLALDFSGPTVVTAHDASWVRYPETHPAERVHRLNRFFPPVLGRSQRIIVDSDFVAREMHLLFGVPLARLRTVYLGVSVAFRPMTAIETSLVCRHHGLSHDGYVLALGTLEPRKNLVSLIRAYRILPIELTRRFPLVIAGMPGWHHQDTNREIAALERAGMIRLLGHVADADLPFLYGAAALFVYPSIYEGFGLPPLEAMAAGVPVIVADRASLPEVVGDAGMRVDPHDIDALAQNIRAVLEDRVLRERMVKAGLERAAMFSWERCASETLAVYREAVAS